MTTSFRTIPIPSALERLLFTYNPFADLDPYPSPGPVFVHAAGCAPFGAPEGIPPSRCEQCRSPSKDMERDAGSSRASAWKAAMWRVRRRGSSRTPRSRTSTCATRRAVDNNLERAPCVSPLLLSARRSLAQSPYSR